MQVTGVLRGAVPVRREAAPSQLEPSGLRDWFGPVVDELYLVTRFAGFGQMYKLMERRLSAEFDESPPLAPKPPVTLERPFVVVPGWTTRRDQLNPLCAKLTEGGRNGGQIVYVREGKFFEDLDCKSRLEELPQGQKVFQVVFSDTRLAPDLSAGELDQNLEAVRRFTGTAKVDVTGYSMGGLATRVYLDRGGEGVGKVMMLGTPNRGATFANLARDVVRRDIRWAMAMAGLSVADLPALDWLSVDNPQLEELNRNWSRQEAGTEAVLTVGAAGLPTPSRGWLPVTGGDGLVEREGVAPPGGEVRILEGEHHHSHLPGDPDAYDAMVEFFGWKPA